MKLYYFPMKGRNVHRPRGKSRRSKLDSRAFFFFENTDDPNYKKKYGKKYSERQLMLLSGEISWEITPINQITTLMRKAEALGDTENYGKAKRLHQLKSNQDKFIADLSKEEAIEILKGLNHSTDE